MPGIPADQGQYGQPNALEDLPLLLLLLLLLLPRLLLLLLLVSLSRFEYLRNVLK